MAFLQPWPLALNDQVLSTSWWLVLAAVVAELHAARHAQSAATVKLTWVCVLRGGGVC